ncbi:MAG TPA: hypothetical protein VMY39_02070, partial [Planctomycetota bacterium]|nr:hypothetical protein [Planctomycetota bacterium]
MSNDNLFTPSACGGGWGRGTIILLGMGEALGFDPTAVWFKELTLLGSMGHGMERHAGERVNAF